MWYANNELVTGVNLNQFRTGGPHIVLSTNKMKGKDSRSFSHFHRKFRTLLGRKTEKPVDLDAGPSLPSLR